MNKINRRSENAPVNRRILNIVAKRFFISALILNIGTALISFVDGLVVAKFLDSTALAAYGLASTVFGIVLFVESVLEVGVKLQITEAYGKGDMKRVSDIFTISVITIIVISAVFTLIGTVFSRQIAVLLGANQELLEGTASYIRGVSIGFPFMMAMGICFVFFFMSSAYKYMKLLGVVSVVLAVLLDIIAGIIHPTLFSFALATSLSYIFTCTAVVICLFKYSTIKLWSRFYFKQLAHLKEIIKDGCSVIVKKCCSMLRPILMNIIVVAVGGTLAAAAFSVRSGIHFLLSSFALSLGSALMMSVRYLYACLDKKGIIHATKVMLRVCLIVGGVISIALYFTAPLITRVYGYSSGELFEKTVLLLKCTAVELLLCGYVGMFVYYLNAIRRQKLAIVFTLINNLLSILASAWVLIKLYGEEGLWYVYPVAAAITCLIISAIRVINYYRSGKTEDSKLFLNRWDGAKDENVLAKMLTDNQQLPELLDEVTEYCLRLGLSEKVEYRCRLAIEELATNFFEHGVPGKEKSFFYVHLAYLNDKLYITINDNCRRFSLVKYMNQINTNSEDPAKGIGLKLIMHASDTIDCSSSFDMNCINITINNT